ncbi:MAG: phytanoyl-CoA dioxygenase family protein [Planctomycetota bacterium]|nr:phytanoyl-CoA dioxygenase family protein [Planctomycetota bacterium]
MKTQLTPEQIASFRENGYVTQEDFLSPAELEQWRAVLDASLKKRGNERILGVDVVKDNSDQYYDRVFIQRVNLWQDNPAWASMVLSPEIGQMCCALEGIDGIRVWHDQTLIKAPWANPTSWHIDNPYWSFSSKHSISIWVALDDATLENGCLFFLPGTQKLATFDAVGIGADMAALFKTYPQWSKFKSVAAPMKAGSCSFHNGLTAHGAHANMTPGFRRAMTCAFMPDGSTFNGKQNIIPRDRFEKLKIGDPLEDDRFNPLVWSRSKKPTVSVAVDYFAQQKAAKAQAAGA